MTQSTLDALADAETLLRQLRADAHPVAGVSDDEEAMTAHLWVGGTLGLGGYLPWECADSARDAARAAFRAVPDLRGESR